MLIIYYIFPEFEPCDAKKRTMFNEVVVPKLENAIISTARKRKHTSRLCYEKAIDLSNLSLSHLVSGIAMLSTINNFS